MTTSSTRRKLSRVALCIIDCLIFDQKTSLLNASPRKQGRKAVWEPCKRAAGGLQEADLPFCSRSIPSPLFPVATGGPSHEGSGEQGNSDAGQHVLARPERDVGSNRNSESANQRISCTGAVNHCCGGCMLHHPLKKDTWEPPDRKAASIYTPVCEKNFGSSLIANPPRACCRNPLHHYDTASLGDSAQSA
jgi:hypothetical protein